MRVAYIINQYPKVSHTFIRREILVLEQKGVEILRIALRGWDSEIVDEQDAAERKRTWYVLRDGALPLVLAVGRTLVSHPTGFVRAFCLAVRMSRRAERRLSIHLIYLAEACYILHRLKANKADHIHAHFGTNSAEVAMLVNELGGPSWSFTVHGPEEFDKAPLIGLAEKVKRAKFVIAVSSYGRSQLYRLVDHALWPKIHIVHCGLDAQYFEGAIILIPDRRRLICVGRLCEQKGQLLLIEAVRRLAANGENFELVLAGDGELRSEIEALVARDKLQDNVRITGWISGRRVREEIAAARALVLPSFAEGLPIVVMEAMGLGRPVISTYVAGIPELVTSGKHGWLIPAGDVGKLCEAMRKCLSASTDSLDQMGRAARNQVLKRHNIDNEVVKLVDLFMRHVKSS